MNRIPSCTINITFEPQYSQSEGSPFAEDAPQIHSQSVCDVSQGGQRKIHRTYPTPTGVYSVLVRELGENRKILTN